MFNSLRARLTAILLVLAVLPALLLGAYFTVTEFNSERQSVEEFQAQVAQRVATEINAFITKETLELRFVPETTNLVEMDTAARDETLVGVFSAARNFNRLILLDASGQEIVHLARREVIPDSALADRSRADEYRVTAAQRTTYYSDIRFDDITGEPSMLIATPLVDLRSGDLVYVLVGELQLRPVWDLITYLTVTEGQDVYVVDQHRRVVAHRNPSVVLSGTTYLLPPSPGEAKGLGGHDVVLSYVPIELGDSQLYVVAELSTDIAYRDAYAGLVTALAVLVITAVVTAIVGLVGVGRLMRPLTRLAGVARRVGAGDLDARADVEGGSEIEAVAIALNDMGVQLSHLIGALEVRVQERTRDLRLAAQVGQQAALILDPDELLPQIVELTKESFRLYHAHVYLLDESSETLALAAGAGDAGQAMLREKHHIPLNAPRSIVARAARDNEPVIVADTTTDPNFLPNPLLPDTRSEAAFPLAVGNRVMGVLDVQSDRSDYFTADVLDVYVTLASQLAVALDNARLFREIEHTSRHEQALSAISEQIQRANSMEELLEVAVRELGKALRVPRTAIELHLQPESASDERAQQPVLEQDMP